MQISRALKWLKWLVKCVVFAILFVVTYLSVTGTNRLQQQTSKTHEKSNTKNHIYLIQAPKCLPSHLATSEYVGNEILCRCDVIVFSFQEKCESSLLRHVEYVHPGMKTSWSQGRNILLERVKRRGKEYKYYIFLDDDVKLAFSEDFPKVKQEATSPLRAFEKFLEDYEPAVGLTDYAQRTKFGLNAMLLKRKRLCKHSDSSKPLHVPVVYFDTLFNAFHHQSLDYLLPYSSKYDITSWWHSQRDIIAKVEITFRGQAVMFAPVRSFNKLHRKYPRKDGDTNRVWSFFVDEVAHKVPLQNRGASIFKKFKENPIHYIENSLSICLKLPSHFPIVPFQHFTWHIERNI